MQPLQICIGPTIRIGQESWCLLYAGFFLPSPIFPCLPIHKESCSLYHSTTTWTLQHTIEPRHMSFRHIPQSAKAYIHGRFTFAT